MATEQSKWVGWELGCEAAQKRVGATVLFGEELSDFKFSLT